MKENFIKNEYIEFWKEDGILFSRFQEGMEVDVERMKEAVKLREEISSGANHIGCMILQE